MVDSATLLRLRARRLALVCALCWLSALAHAAAAGAASYGQISGSVSAASSHLPIPGISVCVTSTEFEFAGGGEEEEHASGCAMTDADGAYTVPELRPGRYTVQFSSPTEGELDYARQFYDGKALPAEAAPVAVGAERVTAGVDAELTPGAEIAGSVTEASGAPLTRGEVCALRPTGAPGGMENVSCAVVGAGGSYTIRGLPSGAYEVVFDIPGFAVEFFDDRALEAEAEAVSVSAPSLTQGVNAVMRPRSGPPVAPGSQAPARTTPAMSPPASPKAPGPSTRGAKRKRPKRGSRHTRPALPKQAPQPATASKLMLASAEIGVTRSGVALVELACDGRAACRGRLTLTDERTLRTGGTGVQSTDAIASSALVSLSGERHAAASVKLNALGRALLRAGRGRLFLQVVIESFG